MRRFPNCFWIFLLFGLTSGCESRIESTPPQNTSAENKSIAKKNSDRQKEPSHAIHSDPPKEKNIAKPVATVDEPPARPEPEKNAPPQKPNYASFGDLLKQPADSMSRMVPDSVRIQVDDQKAAAEGIRKIAGKRLTLYTDAAGEEIDGLPAIFDLAFPQYCEYFGRDAEKLGDWHATGFLMKDKERFIRAGLYPAALPNFPHGFSWNYDLWLYDQPSDYYRRHLLLHEGVHAFMNTVLGGCGSPWYMEGMAEMLATHAWRDGKLTLNYFPQNREEVPEWGRIRIIHDDLERHREMPLSKIIEYPPSAHHSNDAYAWSWAAAKFLDSHPRYQKRFRELPKDVLSPDFNANFFNVFAADLPELYEEWQVFVANLEYGYDIPRTAIDFTPGKPLAAGAEKATATVAADRGWRNSGIRLEGGRKYELAASGRWTKTCRVEFWPGLKNLPEQINVEAGGVSIRYYQGQPLGILQAAVRPDRPNPDQPPVFLHPTTLGLESTLTPARSGTLFFKLNDNAADLNSNEGDVSVEIKN